VPPLGRAALNDGKQSELVLEYLENFPIQQHSRILLGMIRFRVASNGTGKEERSRNPVCERVHQSIPKHMPREERAPQSRLQTPGMYRLDHLYRMEGAQDRPYRAGDFGSPVTVARRSRYSRIRPITTISTVSPVLVSITTFWWTLRSSGDS
jgi:hypothetical protein